MMLSLSKPPRTPAQKLEDIRRREQQIRTRLASREDASFGEYRGRAFVIDPDEIARVESRRRSLDRRRHGIGLRSEEVAHGVQPGEYGARLPRFGARPDMVADRGREDQP